MTHASDNGARAADQAPGEVEFTPPSYALKHKSPPSGRPLAEALDAAAAVIARLAEDYPERAQQNIAELEGAFSALNADNREPSLLGALFAVAHNMRGQGATFDFPLVTEIATNLCMLLEDRERIDDALLDAIEVHIDSLKLVVTQPIKGDGGVEGAELLDGLRDVSAKANCAGR